MNTSSSGSEGILARQERERQPFRSSAPSQPGMSESRRTPMHVIVADSEAIFRVGMAKIFALEKDLEVVAQTDSLQQTLNVVVEHACRRHPVRGGIVSESSGVRFGSNPAIADRHKDHHHCALHRGRRNCGLPAAGSAWNSHSIGVARFAGPLRPKSSGRGDLAR